MQFQLTLTVASGDRRGKCLLLASPGRLFFGRGEDCYEVLPQSDPTAGRYHALLEIEGDRAYVTDLGSTDGTHVNGRRIGGRRHVLDPDSARHSEERVALAHGDHVSMGQTTFKTGLLVRPTCALCELPLPWLVEKDSADRGLDPLLCADCRDGGEVGSPTPAGSLRDSGR